MIHWKKLFLEHSTPSLVLKELKERNALPVELKNLDGVPQSPIHHPEGWSCDELFISGDSCIAGSAQSVSINDGLGLGEVAPCSLADFATSPSLRRTSETECPIDSSLNSFYSADSAGPLSFKLSSSFSETSIAETVPFVFDALSSQITRCASEIIRVMTKISLNSMHPIVFGGVDNLKIIKSIIPSVAVYVMNMLGIVKPSTKMELHNVSMSSDPSIPSSFSCRDVDVDVSVVVVSPKVNVVDGYISIEFDFGVIGTTHSLPPFSTNNTPLIRSVKVCVGDALTHTLMVLDAEADILSREGVVGDRRIYLMCAALAHDFGKATHTRWHETKQKWVSYGHDIGGVPIALAFLKREGLEEYADYVCPLVLNHMVHSRTEFTIKSIKKILGKLGRASVEDLLLLMEADGKGRGTASSELPDVILNKFIPLVKSLV